MIPAIAYGAKSTEDRHDSIPTQIEEAREMAEENGWIVVGEFTDEGFSAYSGNRGPGLEQAKRAAADAAREHGTTCMLIAQASDRFARGAGDRPGAPQSLGEIWHALRRQDVRLRTTEDDFELTNAQTVAAIGHRAMMDSQRKSKAVKKGHARRKARGLHHGESPFGLASRDGILVPIEAEAAVVHRIFSDYIGGRSQHVIARALRGDGIRAKRGGEFRQDAVSRVLRNPVYHERGIIDSTMFEQAEGLRVATGRANRGRRSAGAHLFRGGHLRCGHCGGAITPRSRKGSPHRDFYGCARHLADASDCPMPNVRRELVDHAVLCYFETTWLDVNATREALAANLDRELTGARALRGQAERRAMQAEDRLVRVRRDYQDGRLDADDWSEQRVELTAELEAASAEVDHHRNHESTMVKQHELRDAEAELLDHLTRIRAAVVGHVRDADGIEAVRAALLRLFDSFTLYDDAQAWIVVPGATEPPSSEGLLLRQEWRQHSPLEVGGYGLGARGSDKARLGRVALPLTGDYEGRTVKRTSMFAPIPVGRARMREASPLAT